MRYVRSLLRQSPAVAISLAALIFAVGGGAGYAATVSAPGSTTITFHQLRLHRHWSGSVKYAVNDGVVYLAGDAGSSSRNPNIMATLPRGARPTSSQLDIVITCGATGSGLIQVLNDGTIFPFCPGQDFTFVSLSGISFPLGS